MSGARRGHSALAEEQAEIAPPPPEREASLELLYRTYWHDLRRYIANRFGAGPPEPEEVAQAAFAKLAAVDDISAISDPRGYLFTIACNLVIDDRRRLGHRAAVHRDIQHIADPVSDSSPERVLLGKERLEIFKGALRTMPKLRRRIFLLVRAEGCSPSEVARRFGMSEDAVYKHVQRAVHDCASAFAKAERQT
jgi:RNA polymerase sigma-70 factor (ECF subfamily)